MKFNREIEVSGIRNVVINKSLMWKRYGVDGDTWWTLEKPIDISRSLQARKDHALMISYIKSMASNPQNHVWVHGDTLNIVKTERKHVNKR